MMDNQEFLTALETGTIRVAEPDNGKWKVNIDVKQRILDIFHSSKVVDMSGNFLDKEPLNLRTFHIKDKIRFVPGGSAVRTGAFIGSNIVIMPPSYVNIGAYVDEETMIDSHVLVGSCAQIGKRVHLSAAVQIGGVLEPIGDSPVIVEDNCFIGAGVILVEGVLVRKKAIIAPGVTLSASTPIYDIVNETILKGEIPQNAVVVPGNRPKLDVPFAKEHGLTLGCAVIVKYRDDKTNVSIALEQLLR